MRIAIIALTISEKIFKDGDIIIVEAPFTIAAINVIVIIIIISHTIWQSKDLRESSLRRVNRWAFAL